MVSLDRLVAAPTRHFARSFLFAYPKHTTAMIAALTLAALMEGVGVLTILPVLETVMSEAGGDASRSAASEALVSTLEQLGIAPTLPALLAVIVLAFLIKAAVYFVAMRQVGFTVAHVGHDLRVGLMGALIRASWSHFVRQPLGYVANAISSEAHRASWGYLSLCSAIAEALHMLVYAALILAVSWQAALLTPVAALVLVFAFRPLMAASRRAGNRSTTHLRGLVRRLAEILPGMKGIKAMGLERDGWPLMVDEAERFCEAQRQTVAMREALTAIHELLAAILLAIAVYGAMTWGALPFPTLLLLAALFHRMMTRAQMLHGHLQSLLTNESAFHSIEALTLAAEAAREPAAGRHPPPDLVQGIQLERVSVFYDGKPALSDVSLDLPAGELIAVIGPSGAGKTTLIDLVVGLTPPSTGRVLIDGMPIGELDLAAWRRQIGYLPQEPLLFHDTVRRNIRLDAKDIPDSEIERALRLAEAWDFVVERPSGLDAVVGERGTGLSGGQRQRLCLARALVRRPHLLILDEATSGLDQATERRICQTLRRIAGHTTILAVSHQPAIRAVADKVVMLEHGRLRSAADATA